MLGADVFVVEALCFLVGQCHDFAGTICKSFKHAFFSRPRFDFRVLIGERVRRFVYPYSMHERGNLLNCSCGARVWIGKIARERHNQFVLPISDAWGVPDWRDLKIEDRSLFCV